MGAREDEREDRTKTCTSWNGTAMASPSSVIHGHNTHTCSPSLFHKHCKTHTTHTRQLHRHTRPRLKPIAGTCIDQTFWNANGIDACPAKELTNSLLLNAHVLIYALIVNAVAACALDLWPCYKGKPFILIIRGDGEKKSWSVMLQEGGWVGLADFQCFNFWAARNPLSRYLWRNLRPVLGSSRRPLNGRVLTIKKYLQSKKLKFWFSLPQNQLLFVAYLQLNQLVYKLSAGNGWMLGH